MIDAEELVLELDNSEESHSNFKLATVTALFDNNTAKLRFDGEETASEKQYAYLESYKPTIDDRVLLGVLGGTYVILGKVNYNVAPPVEEEIDRYLYDLKKVIMQKGLSVTLGITTDTLTVNNGATVVGNVGVDGSVNATGISATGAVTGANLNVAGEVKGDTLNIAKAVSLAGLTVTGNEVTNGYHQVKGILYADGLFSHRGSTISFFNKQSNYNKITVNKASGTQTIESLQNVLNSLIGALQNYGLIGGI